MFLLFLYCFDFVFVVVLGEVFNFFHSSSSWILLSLHFLCLVSISSCWCLFILLWPIHNPNDILFGPSDILTFYMWETSERIVVLTMVLNILIGLRPYSRCLISWSVSLYASWWNSIFHTLLRWRWFLVVDFSWLNKALMLKAHCCGRFMWSLWAFLCILLWLIMLCIRPSIPPI